MAFWETAGIRRPLVSFHRARCPTQPPGRNNESTGLRRLIAGHPSGDVRSRLAQLHDLQHRGRLPMRPTRGPKSRDVEFVNPPSQICNDFPDFR
jgi:hypothetical protein